MDINADFDQRVVVHSEQLEWLDSPMPGVRRRMLDRIGDEVARATTIVQYDPDSHFSPHVHTGGEEFIVLNGVFQDEHGDFPVGSYIRNPPQSSHTPGSEPGCIIFVKLWQFDLDDRHQIRIDMDKAAKNSDPHRSGVSITPLYQDERETVVMEQWDPGVNISLDAENGAEILVLDGGFEENGDVLVQHSWLRVPVGGKINATVADHGAKVWMKTGHLRFVQPPQQG